MKTVHKPWGKEIWLELNDRYCYKRIHINAGHRTSLQYHNHKVETNFIISGTAEFWLEDENGVIQKRVMKDGEFITIHPPRKHRVVAITDLILQEASTPEVDDVIRVEDDSHRLSGRIEREHKTPALCIIAAGEGTRLGKIAESTNKGLLPIQNKAVISHIIDKTPADYDVVIALSYKEELVKEYCQVAHPDRKFVFVHVEYAQGPGSGPGKSLSYCKEHLQRPFYLVTADCIIDEKLPPIDDNWLGVFPTGFPEMYSTASVDESNRVVAFKNKSADGFDQAFIGLCAMLDYEVFWEQLEKSLASGTGELVDAFVDVQAYPSLSARSLSWTDVGTIDNYCRARNDFSLHKTGEFIYHVKDRCIKFFADEAMASGRIARACHLERIVPQMVYRGRNFYGYRWEEGKTLYDLDDLEVMKTFLGWAERNLWQRQADDISADCNAFYQGKTLRRMNEFLELRPDISLSIPYVVNGKELRPMQEYLNEFSWSSVNNGEATRQFHGDLQFDNVLYHRGKFTLLDWRHSFGSSVELGDMYYDLAKLYGGVLMSYRCMREDRFTFTENGREVSFGLETTDALSNFRPLLEAWLSRYDFTRIQHILPLIYLSMSPLHPYPMGTLLFFFAQEKFSELYD